MAYIAPPLSTRCADCGGTGKQIIVARVAGEAFDADWVEEDCGYCDGEGEVDARCGFCEGDVDWRGFCHACDESGLTEVAATRLDDGWHRVAA